MAGESRERNQRPLSPVRRTAPKPSKDLAPPDLKPATASDQKLNQYRKRRYEVLHQETEAVAQDGEQGITPAHRQGPPDGEEQAGARHLDEEDRGEVQVRDDNFSQRIAPFG